VLKFNTTLANLKDVKNHFLLSKFGTLEMHLFYVRERVTNCGVVALPENSRFLAAKNRQEKPKNRQEYFS